MKKIVRTSLGVLAIGIFASSAQAQLAGLPVDYSPVGTGVNVSAMFGKGLNEDSGKFNSVGGMLAFGTPMFFVGGGAGLFNMPSKENTDSQFNFGAKAGFNLPLPPATPVSLAVVAGANYWSNGDADIKSLMVPAGVSLGIKVPSTSVAISPWVSPQFRYARMTVNDVSGSTSNFGVSGGLKLGFGMLGIDIAGDYDAESKGFLVGGGLSVGFTTGG